MRPRFTLKLVSGLACWLVIGLTVGLAFSPAVTSDMEVVDVPVNKPVITEIKSHYRIGELIRGNCTGQYSRPATNLTWLINDKPVSGAVRTSPITWQTNRSPQVTTPLIRQYDSVKDDTRNLFSSSLGLILRLTQQHFLNGRLKVRPAITSKSAFRCTNLNRISFNWRNQFLRFSLIEFGVQLVELKGKSFPLKWFELFASLSSRSITR